MYIDHIFFMDEIIKIENEIRSTRKVINLSTWNSSKKYENELFKHITPFNLNHSTKYVYSYDIPIDIRNSCINKIVGDKIEDKMCLFLGNSTLSILNTLNFLKQMGCNHILIINPSYFSVFEACKTLEISYEIGAFLRIDNEYIIDSNEILSKNFDAILITSPIYSTSVPISNNIIELINELTKKEIYVVLDESLSVNGYELIRKTASSPYIIGIYSPHKSMFCNNNKFSAIICSKKYDDLLEQWIDVLNGSLSSSNQQAIYHFLSDNFNECNNFAINYFNKNKKLVIDLLNSYEYCLYDKSAIGPYMTIYLSNVDVKEIYSIEFLKNIIHSTGVSFYPGVLNGIIIEGIANFRINLSLSTNELIYSLKQLLDFIYQN